KYRLQIEAARQAVLVPELGMTEGQRFFERGQLLVKEGKTKEALEVWEQMTIVFKDVESEKEWVQLAEKARRKMKENAEGKQRWASVRAALKRAEKMPAAEAEKIWSAIEALYRADDPFAQQVLEEVREARKKAKAANP